MLGFSSFWMRKIRTPADYLVGGRHFSFWILAGTITAGCIGTGVIVGASGLAYRHGWAGSVYPIALGLGTAFTGLSFAMARRYNFMTLSEEITAYYGGNRIIAEFSNLSLFFSQLFWVTVQIMGGAAVIASVTQLPLSTSVFLAGTIAAGVTIPGGLKSVVYTDFLQALILLTGFSLLSYEALFHHGGWSALRASVPPAYFSFLGIAAYGGWQVAGLLVALILAVVADPGRRLSMYSAKKESYARWAMVAAGLVVIAFSTLIGITGMTAFRLNPHLARPDEAILWLVMHALPAWLAMLVVVSITSGIISCTNGTAMAASTFFIRHIYPLFTRGRFPRRPLLTVRLALVVLFLLAMTVALHAGTIVGFVVKFLPLTMSGVAIIILLGRFWRRSTWQGALAALLVTPLVSLAGMWTPGHPPWLSNAITPTLAGAAAQIVVSLLTPAKPQSFEQAARIIGAARQALEAGESASTVQAAAQ